jgi:L-amino acid N-acyltransferase YncA
VPEDGAVNVRPATAGDAAGMSIILGEIIAAWKSSRPSSADHVRAFYVEHPDRIECLVAEDEAGAIVGFQSLKIAPEDNSWGVSPGWGFIGTYVRTGSGRHGIGRALFSSTIAAARRAGLPAIDATIADDNALGLAYYESMGFRTYRHAAGMTSKVYTV